MKYLVARVVPDVVRNEPINVGLIVHDVGRRTLRIQFSEALTKIQTYGDESFNVGALELILEDLKDGLHASRDDPELLDKISAAYKHQLQFTPPLGTVAADIDAEIEDLYERLISLDLRGRRKPRGVQKRYVVKQTRNLLRAHHVSFDTQQTYHGLRDRFTFDFVHRNGHPHALHCISFDVDQEAATREAKVMAYSALDLKARAERDDVQDLRALEITAIVYPPQTESVRFKNAKRILEEVAQIADARDALEDTIRGLAA